MTTKRTYRTGQQIRWTSPAGTVVFGTIVGLGYADAEHSEANGMVLGDGFVVWPDRGPVEILAGPEPAESGTIIIDGEGDLWIRHGGLKHLWWVNVSRWFSQASWNAIPQPIVVLYAPPDTLGKEST